MSTLEIEKQYLKLKAERDRLKKDLKQKEAECIALKQVAESHKCPEDKSVELNQLTERYNAAVLEIKVLKQKLKKNTEPTSEGQQ